MNTKEIDAFLKGLTTVNIDGFFDTLEERFETLSTEDSLSFITHCKDNPLTLMVVNSLLDKISSHFIDESINNEISDKINSVIANRKGSIYKLIDSLKTDKHYLDNATEYNWRLKRAMIDERLQDFKVGKLLLGDVIETSLTEIMADVNRSKGGDTALMFNSLDITYDDLVKQSSKVSKGVVTKRIYSEKLYDKPVVSITDVGVTVYSTPRNCAVRFYNSINVDVVIAKCLDENNGDIMFLTDYCKLYKK